MPVASYTSWNLRNESAGAAGDLLAAFQGQATDPALRETVQRAGGEQYPVFTVATWPELMDAVDSGKCGIALVDASLVVVTPLLVKRIVELHGGKVQAASDGPGRGATFWFTLPLG